MKKPPATHRPAADQGGADRPQPGRSTTWDVGQWATHIPATLQATAVQASAQQLGQLAAYMALLQRWNATYNLTALREPQDMLSHHLADCLVVVAPLLRHLDAAGLPASPSAPSASSLAQPVQPKPAAQVLDVGSGGGLPGVVLAILCPALRVTCVDTVGKKAAFIRQVAAELALPNLRAEHARVETLRGRFEVITSRAFASLPDFCQWTAHLLAPGGVWMAMKGKPPTEEMAVLPGKVVVRGIEPLHVPGLDAAERCIVWMHPAPQAEQG